MTNEELVILIKQGDTGYIPQLWEQVRRFITQQAVHTYRLYSNKNGAELDDLIQSGYFAVIKAVEYYKPESGLMFTTFLSNTLKTAFAETMGMRCVHAKREPLNNAASLDAPIGGTDHFSLLDTIADLLPDGNDVETEIVQSFYTKELRAALDKALETLTPKRRKSIELRYFFELPVEKIAEVQDMSAQSIYNEIDDSLWKMRSGKYKALLASFIDQPLPDEYTGTGFSAWKQSGMSSAERFLIHGGRNEKDR